MIVNIKATKIFRDLMASNKRIVTLRGGTRSSKTYSLMQYIIICSLQATGKTISIVRKTLPSLKASVLRDFIEILSSIGLYDEKSFNKTEGVYKLNGNMIEFFSVDQPQKIRGRKRQILWCNEGNELTHEDFLQLSLRTTERIFIDYNPTMEENHWIYEQVENRDDCQTFVSTYRDNPFLEPEVIKEIERLKLFDPSYWLVFGEGQKAILKLGNIFMPQYYAEYENIPADIISVIYCDPNLALKGKGDTTAIIELGFSSSTQKYYVINAACQSFDNPDYLLKKLMEMKLSTNACAAIGFDGNVNQESTWTHFIKNYNEKHNISLPKIVFKKYNVDNLVKSCQLAYVQGNILFPPEFRKKQPIFFNQLVSFAGKKAGHPDDAPDALICAFEMINELRYTKISKLIEQPTIYELLY